MFDRCDALKAELDTRRPLPPHTLKSLHNHWVLEEGITIGGKATQNDYHDFLALSEESEMQSFNTVLSLLG